MRDMTQSAKLHRQRREGDGLPVVFLNSLAADLGMWDEVLAGLPGRAALTWDMRGHGRSPMTRESGAPEVSAQDLANDVLDLMQAEGIDRAVLCGLSLGGLVAMAAAEIAPDRVAGLVLANTAVEFPPASMWQDRRRTALDEGMAGLAEATLTRWLTERFRASHPERSAQILRMIAATSPEGYAACCAALAGGDGKAALRDFVGPVLVVAGAHDVSTPVARAQEIADLAQAAELVTLDAAHLSSVEAGEAFASHLDAFLWRVERGRG